MRVGFIGLGSQGGPMARRIVDAGYPTTLWARRPASLELFAGTAAMIAETPADLAADTDLVCLCVRDDADIAEVTGGETGVLSALQPGGVIAVHSTVHPGTVRRLATEARGRQISVLDAPVSGGGPAAADGRLLVMAGGDPDVLERCRPVFESYAKAVVHVGDLGAGQTTKLLNNLLFTAHVGTAASVVDLAEALGIATDRFAQVIAQSSGNSFAFNVVGTPGGVGLLAGHAAALLGKDVRLVVDLAAAAEAEGGAVLDAADAALRLLEQPR